MTSGPRATYPAEQSASSRRRWFYALSALVVIAGIGLAAIAYSKFSTADVSGEGNGYDIINSSTVEVLYTVTRSDPSKPAACVVRGRSFDGGETGRREVLIPPSSSSQLGVRTRVKTSAPPVIGEIFGCTIDIPDYLRADDQ